MNSHDKKKEGNSNMVTADALCSAQAVLVV